MSLSRETLLSEGVADKFMRYCQVNTESQEDTDRIPSTDGQWDLARMLADELALLGLSDVAIDEHSFVIGRLPSNLSRPAPAVGFVAHMDTVSGVPGAGVKPILHTSYSGGMLEVGNGVALNPEESEGLKQAVGYDIITSDGSTLLGTDDKAGIADIMCVLAKLISHPEKPHPDVWVAFTPDEETGNGVSAFPYDKFGAKVAYTLDGSVIGELSCETFNAVNGVVVIRGVSSHTGDARGKMVNALHIAAQLIASIPAAWRPETTSDREGFTHPNDISGNVEEVSIKFIIRDFNADALAMREKAFVSTLKALELNHPGAKISWQKTGGYRNMKERLDADPRVSAFAEKAMHMAGVTPRNLPIRGGTDGARMSYEGVLTPNLFTGGSDVHSRREWACVQWMEKACEVCLNIVGLWAEESK